MKRTETEALAAWNLHLPTQLSPDQGLINQTWIVGAPGKTPMGVLQWVNPIFDSRIHNDLRVVLDHLQTQGALTPDLVPLPDGSNVLEDTDGCWRLWSFIPGRTIHSIESEEQAYGAGLLLGQFHAQLSSLEHSFTAPRRDIHNTPQRMQELKQALRLASGRDNRNEAQWHRQHLEKEAVDVGTEILNLWQHWAGELRQPVRICHGDPKISNLRFSPTRFDEGCLIDLDTIGPSTLAVELGDAWRSWCNPSGEDHPEEVIFNTKAFSASASGWLEGWSSVGAQLDDAERHSLVPGIERICLELSARFCTDAIQNSYFKEDRERFPVIGAHNLIRAKSQLALAKEAKACAADCQRILGN